MTYNVAMQLCILANILQRASPPRTFAPLRNGLNRDRSLRSREHPSSLNQDRQLLRCKPSRPYAQAKQYKVRMPSVTSPSAAMVTSPVDEDPWASAPVSRANSVHLRRRNRTRTNPEDMAPSSSAHPLAGVGSSSATADAAAEASRPTLRRLTTENERQVAEASRSGSEGGSMRGSLDLLRMTVDPSVDGVEVLIHEVSSTV